MHTYTTQKQLRAAFWAEHPGLTRRPGRQNDQAADTRAIWCDWLDRLQRDGQISEALAARACAMTHNRYLRLMHWARRRYTVNGSLPVSIGTTPAAYTRIEAAAWRKLTAR